MMPKAFPRWCTPRSLTYSILILLAFLLGYGIVYQTSPEAEHLLPDSDYMQLDTKLSSRQIHCFREDSDGYVWIGTERGLNRYDGNLFLQFFATSDSCSLVNNDIIDIQPLRSHPDILLVITYNGSDLLFPDYSILTLTSQLGPTKQYNDSLFIAVHNNELQVLNVDLQQRSVRVVKQRRLEASFSSLEVLPDSCFWAFNNSMCEQFDIHLNHRNQQDIESVGHFTSRRSEDECWLQTEAGLISFRLSTGEASSTAETDFVNSNVRNIELLLSQDSLIIIKEYNSPYLQLFNLATYTCSTESFDELMDTQIGYVMVDSHQNVWCGSRSMGFDVHFRRRTSFASADNLSRFFANRGITSITQLSDGRLCVLVGFSKIYTENLEGDIVEVDISALPATMTTHVASLSNNHLLVIKMNTVYECQVSSSGQLQLIRQLNMPSNIHSIIQAQDNRLWVACSDGCYSANLAAGTYSKLLSQLPSSNIVSQLADGRIVFGSLANGISVITPGTLSEKHYELPLDKPGLFSCRDLTQDAHGDIWIASIGMGIFRLNLQTGQVTNYRAPNLCSDVSCILSDPLSDDIWLGTLNGLSRFDSKNEQFLTFYEADGVQGDEFFERCAIYSSDSTLIFGGKQGLTIFAPSQISPQMSQELRLSQVLIGNHILTPGYQEHGYAYRVDENGRPLSLTLPYDMSNLRLCLSTLNFGDYSRPHLLYRLSDIDKDNEWHWALSSDIAYNKLEAGDYTLEVRSLDQNGNLLNSLSFDISVTPVWWQVWWLRYIYYPLLGILLLLLIATLTTNAVKRRHRIRDSLREKVAIRYASDMNMRFFTNMAHEFRTPLTLISGANGMLGKSPVNDDERHAMGIISNNTNRLLRLVNQLLDFNKLEHDMVRLCVQPTKVQSIVEQLMQMYQMGFQERGIELSAQFHGLDNPVWIDPDKFDKIIANLLSNALKFTPKGGKVTISISADADTLFADVSDTGIGIPDNMLESIFDRYYQTSEGAMKQNATGIGLCYCRGLAKLHHGTIIARHNPHAEQGSSFLLTLPILKEAYDNAELSPMVNAENLADMIEGASAPEVPSAPSVISSTDAVDASTVLVVDDEPEVVNFLRLILGKTYHVVTENSATEAIAHIPDLKPDLIVSDVMMLGMDGFKFCQLLKEDIAYCHIPVVLLTAKVSLEERIQGLNVGADAYVTKPFEPAYLLALIKSMLDNRRRIQHMLSTNTFVGEQKMDAEAQGAAPQTEADNTSAVRLSAQDSAFMDKLYTFMEEHLSEAELDLEQLLDIAVMSRSKLYYKVKGLTGMTPNAFFKTYKLNRAAEMIRQGDVKLTYIAELTGFSGSSHFAASFKKQFGVLPSEYGSRKQL